MGCVASKPAEPVAAATPVAAKAATAAAPPVPAAVAAPGKAALRQDSPTSPLDSGDGVLGRCYKTEAETARLQALLDCKCLDTVDERRFDAITKLLKDMFDVPMALVSLIDDDRLVFKSVAGTDCRQGNRLHSFCDASLRAPNPTMMIVPDTLEDPRFCGSQFVAGAPHVRFYSGAPLISSDGHVLGSLGLMDIKPRSFPAGALNVICNFAELVVREMERDKAALERRRRADATDKAAARTVRALSAFDEAVVLCNTSAGSWPVLYVNQEWCEATGSTEEGCLGSGLWDLLAGAPGYVKDQAQAAIKDRRAFELALEAPGAGGKFTLELRPATRDHLSLASPKIAIPNFVEGLAPAELSALDGLYFAVVRKPKPYVAVAEDGQERLVTPPTSADHNVKNLTSTGTDASHDSFASSSTFGLECPDELAGLALGPMLGRGGMGKVYRGTWHDKGVAVKIVDNLVEDGEQATGPMVEALLSKQLSHPHIVQTHEFAVKALDMADELDDGSMPTDDEDGEAEAPKLKQLWIIQQYCERGTLGDAIDRGWLRLERTPASGPNMGAVLRTALEVADAMSYLHDQNVLHGDLTPGNVLLAAPEAAAGSTAARAGKDPRQFSALVGDFGLSRVLDATKSQVQTTTFGTVSHMPNELIEQQLLTKATDVYSFGVLLWEMYAGRRAWAGMSAVRILYSRTAKKERLKVPTDWPAGYAALVEACLQDDHTLRPTFADALVALSSLLADE